MIQRWSQKEKPLPRMRDLLELMQTAFEKHFMDLEGLEKLQKFCKVKQSNCMTVDILEFESFFILKGLCILTSLYDFIKLN